MEKLVDRYVSAMHRNRRRQGIKALTQYVATADPLVKACMHATKLTEPCIEADEQVPQKEIQQLRRSLEPFLEPLKPILYSFSFKDNVPFMCIEKWMQKSIKNMDIGTTLQCFSLIKVALTTKEKPAFRKCTHVFQMNNICSNMLLFMEKLNDGTLTIEQGFGEYSFMKYMIVPTTYLSFELVQKSNNTFVWKVTAPDDTSLSNQATKATKLTKAQKKTARQHMYHVERNFGWYSVSMDPRIKTCAKRKLINNLPKSMQLTYHQAQNQILSLRTLADPLTSVVFRGTQLPYPFVDKIAPLIKLKDMKVNMTLHLKHPLSTSMDRSVTSMFSSTQKRLAWNKHVVKPSFVHKFELENVPAILIPSFANKLKHVGALAYNEKEVLILPDNNVTFTLTSITKEDTKVDKKADKVGHVMIQKLKEEPQNKKSKISLSVTPIGKIGKEETPQNMLKTKKDTSQRKQKGGRIVFTWSVKGQLQNILQLNQRAKELRKIYDKGFAFPQWTCDLSLWHVLDWYATSVFYDDRLPMVKKLLLEREPCNINMERLYDQKQMKKVFGWSTSFYQRYFERTGRLAPNVAVYVRTPMFFYNQRYKHIHLINLIGLAFDNPHQPDAQYYRRMSLETVRQIYLNIWKKAFVCATHLGIKEICPVVVGGGAFSPMAPSVFKRDVHDFVLSKLLTDHSHVRLIDVGQDVVQFIDNTPKADLNYMLFVNAWDPHTILGNGNAMDDSLDGVFGRHTAIGVLGWPATNPNITYHKI